MKQRLLALGLLLWLSATACMAAGDTATQADLTAAKELHQAKLDAVKELHQKDVDALRQQVAAVDKRVDDQLAQVGQAVDRFSAQSAWTGILITVLMVFGGFLGYRNAKQEAKADAIDQANETARQWFEQHAQHLKSRLEELEHKVSQTHQQMDDAAKDVADHAEDIKERQKQALATVQDTVGKTNSTPSPEEKQAQEVLRSRAEELKNLGESSRSFDDWKTLAHTAYAANNLEDAAYYWHKAAEVPHAGAVNVAKVLFNRGVAQGKHKQPEAAIATYDELLRRFADAPEPALREQVAKALINKGVAQGQVKQPEAEIATYDELLRRFGDATEPALREPVAKALFNKGFRQGQLNQSEAAIATYDELLRRFGEATEPVLREHLAKALLNKAVTQRQLNQSEAAIATYDKLLHRFGDATEPVLRELVAQTLNDRAFNQLMQAKQLGLQQAAALHHLQAALGDLNQSLERMATPSSVVLGNRAYVQQLLGNAMQAEADFAAGLRAREFGGQALFDATLKDLDMHPIAEDKAMRDLVERVWAAYQQEQGSTPPSPPPTA